MKKHPLLKAAAAAGAAVLGAAYGVYRVGFYNKPTTAGTLPGGHANPRVLPQGDGPRCRCAGARPV